MNNSMRILAAVVILVGVDTVLADYEVEYNVELKGNSSIKFEDAKCFDEGSQHGVAACLGEDGAVETDTFVCTVEGECDCVTISVKAGRGKTAKRAKQLSSAPMTPTY